MKWLYIALVDRIGMKAQIYLTELAIFFFFSWKSTVPTILPTIWILPWLLI
jgi:hypothetical protein